MKISTKGRYALRIMLDLAFISSQEKTGGEAEYVSLKEIAARQEVSEKYAEQIINQLHKGGFVKSIRGARGGYRLQVRAEECTAGSILRLMEGSLAPVPCAETGSEEACSRLSHCAASEVWKRLKDAIDGVVDGITLSDLLQWQEEKQDAESIEKEVPFF